MFKKRGFFADPVCARKQTDMISPQRISVLLATIPAALYVKTRGGRRGGTLTILCAVNKATRSSHLFTRDCQRCEGFGYWAYDGLRVGEVRSRKRSG